MKDEVLTYNQDLQNIFDTCSSAGGTRPTHLTHSRKQTIQLKLELCVEAG